MIKFFVFLGLVALASSNTTQVVRCTQHQGDLPINTYIEGCTTPPCLLPQLQDAIIKIVFKAPRVIHSMRTLATAYLSMGIINLPIPYDLGENAVTCNFLDNTYCPVLSGEIVQYTLRMYIESFFPVGTSVNIEFRVVDDRNEPLLCIRTGLRITAPLEGRSNATLIIEDNE